MVVNAIRFVLIAFILLLAMFHAYAFTLNATDTYGEFDVPFAPERSPIVSAVLVVTYVLTAIALALKKRWAVPVFAAPAWMYVGYILGEVRAYDWWIRDHLSLGPWEGGAWYPGYHPTLSTLLPLGLLSIMFLYRGRMLTRDYRSVGRVQEL